MACHTSYVVYGLPYTMSGIWHVMYQMWFMEIYAPNMVYGKP